MKNRTGTVISACCIALFLFSCSAKKISSNYYLEHEKVLDQIEESYKQMYRKKPFTIAFADKAFSTVTLDIITDSITYIYEIGVNEPRFTDTLNKYSLDVNGVKKLVSLMQSIRCTWVNNFDYYVDEQKKSLIFISIKPVTIRPLLSYKKYYILTYFSQPQQFDEKGRLLVKRRLRKLHKINGEIFYRINDKVCYTISGQFR